MRKSKRNFTLDSDSSMSAENKITAISRLVKTDSTLNSNDLNGHEFHDSYTLRKYFNLYSKNISNPFLSKVSKHLPKFLPKFLDVIESFQKYLKTIRNI